jgi:transposase
MQGSLFCRTVKKIIEKANVEIVKRSDQTKGFVVSPKRWMVERIPGSSPRTGCSHGSDDAERWPRTEKTSTAKTRFPPPRILRLMIITA